ncbi:F-box domain-containing protein [Xylariaceae sp. FL0804]|nr:F-box domain-containing protein [Xylariaceae sp. FL0804]
MADSGADSGAKPTVTLNAPNAAVSYGRINPEVEENFDAVQSVPSERLRGERSMASYARGRPSDSEELNATVGRGTDAKGRPASAAPSGHTSTASFLELPSELIDAIFSLLTPLELASAAQVCRKLRDHAAVDIHWQRHVHANLPGRTLSSPYPCKTWRQLYVAHDPYWFLAKQKIWFADRGLTGQMIVVRYDERRGCIEGYQLVATRVVSGSEPWVAHWDVDIHYFDPRVGLHLDKPVIQLNVDDSDTVRPTRHASSEQPMRYGHGSDPRFSNLLLAKPLNESSTRQYHESQFPYGFMWPPPLVPAAHRVLGQPALGDHSPNFSPSLFRPSCRSEASDQAFRIRQWMEMGPVTLGVHFGEEVSTYATLDPYLYTPTREKPWRGIWVGDYSGHGCEFLLMNQPDDEEDANHEEEPSEGGRNNSNSDSGDSNNGVNTDDENRSTPSEVAAETPAGPREPEYRGRLEAIKLTGDANVPRGEYTFVVDELGEEGTVGVALEPPFKGARMVRSKGHIASTGFLQDKYIESQLILISHDRLAQYWVEFGHISFFQRVDIDQFLTPRRH